MQTMAFAVLALDNDSDPSQFAQESLNTFQLLQDRRGEATALNVLGQISWSSNQQDRARTYVEQAVTAAKDAGDDEEQKWAESLLGEYAGMEGQTGGGKSEKNKTKKEKRTGKAIQNMQYSNIYCYNYGKDYTLFYEFTMRGTDQQVANLQKNKKKGSSGSSSSQNHGQGQEQQEQASEEQNVIDFGIDFASLGNI